MMIRNLHLSRLSGLVLQSIRYIVLFGVSLVIVIPLVTAVLNGFKTNAQVLADPFGFPSNPQWSNYLNILEGSRFWTQLFNSTFVAFATTFGIIALAGMSAFVFARIRFRGRELAHSFMLIGLLYPITVAILPLYITLRNAGLTNTLWGVIIPQTAFGIPISIVILRNFFISVPFEMEEASRVDGCPRYRFFLSILIPLSSSAIASVAVLQMAVSWNAYFLPLIILTRQSSYTLPLGTMQFQQQLMTNWALTLAYVSLSMTPAILFYFFAQKRLVSGLVGGSLKG